MRTKLLTLALIGWLGLLLSGCELIVDFDRSQIPARPDGGVDGG